MLLTIIFFLLFAMQLTYCMELENFLQEVKSSNRILPCMSYCSRLLYDIIVLYSYDLLCVLYYLL